MPRTMLSDPQWELLCQSRYTAVTFTDNKNIEWPLKEFFIACGQVVRRRDLPEEFGRWNTWFTFSMYGPKNGVFELIFNQLLLIPILNGDLIDGALWELISIVRGAASQEPQGIGKSRGGNTTRFIWLSIVADSQFIFVNCQRVRSTIWLTPKSRHWSTRSEMYYSR